MTEHYARLPEIVRAASRGETWALTELAGFYVHLAQTGERLPVIALTEARTHARLAAAHGDSPERLTYLYVLYLLATACYESDLPDLGAEAVGEAEHLTAAWISQGDPLTATFVITEADATPEAVLTARDACGIAIH